MDAMARQPEVMNTLFTTWIVAAALIGCPSSPQLLLSCVSANNLASHFTRKYLIAAYGFINA
jgi:hypothetical protein